MVEATTDDTTKRDSPEGIRFVHTAEAHELPDDTERVCAYCNSDTAVEERKHSTLQAAIDGDRPLPPGTTVTANFKGDAGDTEVKILDSAESTAMDYVYETLHHGEVGGGLLDLETAGIPNHVGFVTADVYFVFGHEDAAGVKVPVCEMCLGDMPVEWADEQVHTEMSYKYHGDGEVRKSIVTERDGTTVHTSVPVDENGVRVEGGDAE